jgi:hypothetical protein
MGTAPGIEPDGANAPRGESPVGGAEAPKEEGCMSTQTTEGTHQPREEPTGLPQLLEELIENARLQGYSRGRQEASVTAKGAAANARDANRYRLEVNRRKKHLTGQTREALGLLREFRRMLVEMDKGEIVVGESGTPAMLERVAALVGGTKG